MVEKLRPFADLKTQYTTVHNYAFDVCMPSLSNAGWRILCVAIRKTLGWSDDSTPSGRREWDRISYSQFREASGLRSDASVRKGLKENMEAGYMIRRKVGNHQGTGAPLYAYCLNQDYEVNAPATTESIVETANPKTSTSKNEVEPTSKNEAAATTETVETKEKKKPKGKEKDHDPFSSLWSPFLDALKGTMTRQTFDTWLRGSRLIDATNETWTVELSAPHAVEWVAQRLYPGRSFQHVMSSHAPGVEEIRFIAKEEPTQ